MDRDGLPEYSIRSIAIVCLSRPKALHTYDRLENAARTALLDVSEYNSALTMVRCTDNARQRLLEKKRKDGLYRINEHDRNREECSLTYSRVDG